MCLSQIVPPGFAAGKDRLEEEAFLANHIRDYIVVNRISASLESVSYPSYAT
jgi:hypothetical protein